MKLCCVVVSMRISNNFTNDEGETQENIYVLINCMWWGPTMMECEMEVVCGGNCGKLHLLPYLQNSIFQEENAPHYIGMVTLECLQETSGSSRGGMEWGTSEQNWPPH